MNPKTGGICGCLSGLERSEEYPTDSHPCPECGEVTLPGQTLCVFCTSKHNQPQSYPPSIVPAAVDEMKSAIMDSMMLTLTNIVEQADALIVQLARLKGAIK
jgi:hypothetical protein